MKLLYILCLFSYSNDFNRSLCRKFRNFILQIIDKKRQIMATTNFNVRLDEHLRTEATQILANYGLLPTQAIKLFFNQVVATHKIPLSFDCHAAEKQLTAKLLSAISELGYLSFLFLHH
mgnify:FL=1